MESASPKTGKLRRPMTAKCWTLSLVGTMAFVMVMIAVVNYIVDPFGYFQPRTADRGAYSYDGSYNTRLSNFRYFEEHHPEYNGVILGGSKSMFLEESYFINGEKYCNLAINFGRLYDYLSWTEWIADNTDIQHILISLSTLEVGSYTPEERDEDGTGQISPAELDQNKNRVIQFIQYLYKGGVKPSLQYLKSKKNGSLYWVGFYGQDFYYPFRNPDPMPYYRDWISELNNYLDRSVNGIYEPMPAIKQNLAALQEIKEICEESGIQLSVVIAPTSTIQYLLYESPEYWDYLRDMAQIVDYWDFSMPNAINANMFNFYDEGHLFTQPINHMFNQMYGMEPDNGSGVYVTRDNVEEYLLERQRRYYALMEEYAETGTVRQGMYFDEGYLMSDMFYPVISNAENEWTANIPLKDHLNVTQHFYAGFDHLEGIAVFVEGVPQQLEDLGNLKLRVYDDTGRHTLYSGDVDLSGVWTSGREFFIHFGGLELTEGHWYSLIFSYEPKTEDDSFGFQCVDGESTGNLYMELDGIPQWYEVKMNLYRSQTYGNYRQGDAVLQTDQMRGEGEDETLELTGQTRYTQTFTADCDLLSYIQLKTSHLSDPEEPEPVDEAYSIILELRGPDGTLMSRKTIMGAVLQNADVYNVTFDGDLYLEPGKTYELTVYANKTTEQGLKLLTHGEESGSALYLNGVKTGESLCYRIYGVSGAEIEYRRANVHG